MFQKAFQQILDIIWKCGWLRSNQTDFPVVFSQFIVSDKKENTCVFCVFFFHISAMKKDRKSWHLWHRNSVMVSSCLHFTGTVQQVSFPVLNMTYYNCFLLKKLCLKTAKWSHYSLHNCVKQDRKNNWSVIIAIPTKALISHHSLPTCTEEKYWRLSPIPVQK